MTCTLIKEELSKDFIDKGAMDVNNKITDSHLFTQLNNQYSKAIQDNFKLDQLEYVFSKEKNKAIANEEFLSRVDELRNPELEVRDYQAGKPLKVATAQRIEKAHEAFYSRLDTLTKNVIDQQEDTLATTEAKINRMKEVFDAEVVIDSELEASGALLAANHPLSVRAGKPVIVINPNLIFSDTVFHEFGHLYIDLLGGLQDPVVAQAVAQLKKSTLWTYVADAYPELSGDNLAKEVLATALGVEGNNIFNRPESETVWQQIKQALLTAINNILGTNYGFDAIEAIASEMLSGDVRVDSTAKFNTIIDQHSKLKIDPKAPGTTQEKADSLMTYLNEKYRLDDPTHIYEDTETGENFSTSVTSFAKQLTLGRHNFNIKGDFYMDLTPAHELTKTNYSILLEESRLPWSLDKALEAFFNGDIDNNLPYNNNDEDTYWFKFYNELTADPLVEQDDLGEIIIKHLPEINALAKQIEKEKSVPMLMGTEVHKALETYIDDRNNGREGKLPTNIKDTKKQDLLNEIKGIIDTGMANGSKFYSEQILFSESAQKPGTADLIEITKDGKFKIYDFKTTKSFNNKWGEQKSDYYMYVEPGYLNQLIIYSTILEEYGLKPANDHLNIVSIAVDNAEFNPDDIENSTITIKGVINKNISPKDKKFTNSFQDAQRKIVAEFTNPRKLGKFNIKTKQQKVDKLIQKIQRGIIDYKGLTNTYTGKFIADSLKSNRSIYTLEADIEKLVGKNNGLILYRYINHMRDALSNVYGEATAPNAILSSNYLKNVEYLLQASSFIPEVKRFIEQEDNNYAIETADKNELLKLLAETEDAINHVKDMQVQKTKELAVRSLAINSNFMEGLYTEKFEIEARKEGHKTKEAISKYIYEQLMDSDNKKLIIEAEYQYWEGLLENGYTDIRYFEYLLADPGMNKSQFVQVVKNILDKVDNDIRIDLDSSIPEIVKWHSELGFNKTGDPAKIWKNLLVKAKYTDIDGKEVDYTHGSVIAEKTSEYREIFVKYKFQIDDINRKINAAFAKKDTKRVEELQEARANLKTARSESLKEASKEVVVNPAFAALTDAEKEALRFIHKKLEEADERLSTAPTKKLVLETRDGTKIYTLPKMRKTKIEASYDRRGLINTYVSSVQDMMRPPADEDDLNLTSEEQKDYEDYKTKNTDILGEPSYDVPVFYRNELEDPTLQSFDIPTLLALNEETTIAYYHHKTIEADLHMITNSLKNSAALKTDAIVSNNVVDKLQDKLPKALRAEGNLTLKAVEASINNRFYKRAYHGSYSKWHYRGIKAAEALSSGTSMLLLAGNFRSASMTAIQGTIYRFIEGVAGENFSLENAKRGSQKAYSDIDQIIKDTQEHFPKSKTNLLIRRFGLETQYKALVNKFVQDNFVTKNLDQGAMFAITTIAETMVTANLMYTLLDNIKVMNSEGDYINSKGEVVTKKDAMSLDEAYEVQDGKLVLNENVVFTDRNLNNEFNHNLLGEKTIASTEISRYIRSIYADLYGQYNQDMKSVAEMTVLGKMAFSMRKWIPRGYHRRWRGFTSATGYTFEELHKEENSYKRFYSQDQKKFQEGYYTTGVRFAATYLKELKSSQLSFMAAAKNVTNTMTTHELANLKRLAYELAVIGVSFFTAMALRGIAKAMDDDDDRSDDKIYYLLYLLERIKMESATFINPMELIENLRNPAAAVNTLERLYNTFTQIIGFGFDDDGALDFSINDTYERGLRKGEYKITKHLQHLIPWYKNVSQFAGMFEYDSNETIKDSYKFISK